MIQAEGTAGARALSREGWRRLFKELEKACPIRGCGKPRGEGGQGMLYIVAFVSNLNVVMKKM